MESMEGTKLGENHFSAEKELLGDSSSRHLNTPSAGTKIGEQSDFEKSLGLGITPPVPEKKEAASPAEKLSIKEVSPQEQKSSATAKNKEGVMDDMMNSVKDYQVGDIVTGMVSKVEKGLVFVDISHKSEGIIESEELTTNPNLKATDIVKPGEEIKVMILKIENKDGNPVLSKRRADYENCWLNLHQAQKNKDSLDVYVTNSVKGGLIVDYGGIRGFVPASHVSKEYQNDLESLVKQTISVKPIEVNRQRRKVLLSHRMAYSKKDDSKNKELLKSIEPGQVKQGKVTNIKPYGAFVDIGGLEGLVHISEMSWSRISKPEEVVQIGQTIDVFVLGIDDETGKVSLGIRQLQPDPWVNVEERYRIGQKVNGKITRLVKFGAFIELEKGLEGLIHISELAANSPQNPEDIVTAGQFVEATIIKIFPAEQRIGLSLKEHPELQETSEIAEYQKEQATANAANTPKLGDLIEDQIPASEAAGS